MRNKAFPKYDDFLDQSSCSCHQRPVGPFAVRSSTMALVQVFRKEGVGLEHIHTIMQQVFRILTPPVRDATWRDGSEDRT